MSSFRKREGGEEWWSDKNIQARANKSIRYKYKISILKVLWGYLLSLIKYIAAIMTNNVII